jgi:hypothetical protein
MLLHESEAANSNLRNEILVLQHTISSQTSALDQETINAFMKTIEQLQEKILFLQRANVVTKVEAINKDLECSVFSVDPLKQHNSEDLPEQELQLEDNLRRISFDVEADIDIFPDTDFQDLSMIGSLLGDDPSQLLNRPIKIYQSDSKEFTVNIIDDHHTRCSTPVPSKIETSPPIPSLMVLDLSISTSKYTSRSNTPMWIPVPILPCESPTKEQLKNERDSLEEELIQRYAQIRMMEERFVQRNN